MHSQFASPSMPATLAAASTPILSGARDPDDVEREINELTWTVLDGSATPADRARLALLVKIQHAARRRAG